MKEFIKGSLKIFNSIFIFAITLFGYILISEQWNKTHEVILEELIGYLAVAIILLTITAIGMTVTEELMKRFVIYLLDEEN